MKDKSRVFLNSVIVFVSTFLENVIFFVINVLIARYLSVEKFGEYTTALGYATFFSTITNIGINQNLIRVINLHPEKKREHFTSAFICKISIAFFIYSLMAGSLFFTNYSRELVSLTLIMGLFRIGSEIHSTFYSFYDARETFILSSAYRVTFALLFLLLTIAVIFYKGGIFDFAYVRLWLVVAFIGILILTTIRIITLKIDYSSLVEFLKESIPFGIYTILMNVYQRVNIIILSLFHGSIYAGIFSNGFVFFTTLFIIPVNLSRVLLPFLYKTTYTKESEKFQFAFDIYTKYLTMAAFYFTMGALLFGKEVMYLIFSKRYHDSIIVLQIISAGIPFIFSIAPTIITSLNKHRVLTKIYIKGFILNIVSNILLIWFLKSEGAAISAVVTYGYVFFAATYYLIKSNIITAESTIKAFTFQIAILLSCYLIKEYFLNNTYWILSLVVISFIWIIHEFIFVMNKTDARIIMEILNINKFPIKIYRK